MMHKRRLVMATFMASIGQALALAHPNVEKTQDAERTEEYYPPKPKIDSVKVLSLTDLRKQEQEEWNKHVEQRKIDKKARKDAQRQHTSNRSN